MRRSSSVGRTWPTRSVSESGVPAVAARLSAAVRAILRICIRRVRMRVHMSSAGALAFSKRRDRADVSRASSTGSSHWLAIGQAGKAGAKSRSSVIQTHPRSIASAANHALRHHRPANVRVGANLLEQRPVPLAGFDNLTMAAVPEDLRKSRTPPRQHSAARKFGDWSRSARPRSGPAEKRRSARDRARPHRARACKSNGATNLGEMRESARSRPAGSRQPPKIFEIFAALERSVIVEVDAGRRATDRRAHSGKSRELQFLPADCRRRLGADHPRSRRSASAPQRRPCAWRAASDLAGDGLWCVEPYVMTYSDPAVASKRNSRVPFRGFPACC